MDILNISSLMLEVAKPTGMWESIVFGLETLVKNYGLTIILVTLAIKLIMLPFDFYNRYINKRNSSKMAVIQPELEKIQKKYGANRDVLNQKTMELYKKHNYNVMGSCLGMLLNMVLTMVVFFTLFSGLNKIASYKIYTEYTTLQATYEQVVGGQLIEQTEKEQKVVKVKLTDGSVVALDETKANEANQAVIQKYDEVKESFLWIKNIWRPDTNASVMLSYDDFISNTKIDKSEINEQVYYQVTNPIRAKEDGWNGYYILILLSAATSYLSTQVSVWLGKAKAKRTGKPYVDAMSQNKILIYVMPIVMAMFALFYNAMFALYMVTGSLFGLATSPLITMLVDKVYEKAVKKEEEKTRVSYSRK